jgi:small subunit ribosomal protein S1
MNFTSLEENSPKASCNLVIVDTVRHIKHFGVFINIGGLVGLLRITEISHDPLDSPHSIFKVNTQLKVMIIDLDFEQDIISLSTKALEPEQRNLLRNPLSCRVKKLLK